MNNKETAPLYNETIELKVDMKGQSHFIRYDEGLREFLKTFFVGDVVIAPVDEFWQIYTKTSKNHITLPAVSLFPVNYNLSEDGNSFPNYQIGTFIEDFAKDIDEATNTDKGNTIRLSKAARVLFYDIDYDINVWAQNRNDALQLVQELLFPLTQHGEYQIRYFDTNYFINYKIDPNFENNSSYGMNQEEGLLYRYTIHLHTEHCPIFDSKNYYNVLDNKTSVELVNKDLDIEKD